jgi:hypothetical protein
MVATNARYYNTTEIIHNLKNGISNYDKMLKCGSIFDSDENNIKLDPIRLFNKYRKNTTDISLSDWQQFFSVERIKIFINSSVIALGEARVRTFILTLQKLMDFINETTATDLLNIDEELADLEDDLDNLGLKNKLDLIEREEKQKRISKLLSNKTIIAKMSQIWLKQINDTYKSIQGDLGVFIERLENLAGNNGTSYVYGLIDLNGDDEIKHLDTVVGDNFILKIKTKDNSVGYIQETDTKKYIRNNRNGTIFTLSDFQNDVEKRDIFIKNIQEKFIMMGRVEAVTVSI